MNQVAKTKDFRKVMVANRGEIAIRIFRACYDLGLNTVAVYSKEDEYNIFRVKADESYMIGENKSPLGAYLDIDLMIDIAKKHHVDAIHPGYGFLSENAAFARACEENGIEFIGPPSDVLAQMGDKLSAKEIAKRCQVPTIPGSKVPSGECRGCRKKGCVLRLSCDIKSLRRGRGKRHAPVRYRAGSD